MDLARLTDLRFVVAALYWGAAVAYLVALRARGRRASTSASTVMTVAVAIHVAEYVGRGALHGSAGGAPFTGVSGFLSLAALLLAAANLLTEKLLQTRSLGAFAVPLVALLHTGSVVAFQAPTAVPEQLRGPALILHIALVTLAFVGLAAAFVSGVTYLALDAMLRWKRTGVLFRRLPNLELLSRVHRGALVAGANLLGLGAVAGALWARSVWGFYFSWDQPKLVITLVAFLAGNASVLAWRVPPWRGRKAAWIAVTTIGLTFASMALAGTFADERHRFV